MNSVSIGFTFLLFHCFVTNCVLSIAFKYDKQKKESNSNHLNANLFDKLINLNSLNNSSQTSSELQFNKRNDELPVFFGGSFDFDLTPLAALISPIMNFIKNSEIIQVEENNVKVPKPPQRKYNHFYDYKSEESEPIKYFEAMPRPRPRPIYQSSYEELYPEVMEDVYIEKKKPKKKIKKKKKRPAFESIDSEDLDEEDIVDIGETVVIDLLETGIAGAILHELIGFNKPSKIISPLKILKHLTLGALSRALIKKTFKSILTRMIPDSSYFYNPNLAYILKKIASRRCRNVKKFKIKENPFFPVIKTVHRLLFPIMPLILLTASPSRIIDTLACFFSYAVN